MRTVLVTLLLLSVRAIHAAETNQLEATQTLTGTLKVNAKSSYQYELNTEGPFSKKLTVRGELLGPFHAGDHVLVEGIIRTRFVRPYTDGIGYYGHPYWDIFMDVSKIRRITKDFDLPEEDKRADKTSNKVPEDIGTNAPNLQH